MNRYLGYCGLNCKTCGVRADAKNCEKVWMILKSSEDARVILGLNIAATGEK